MVLRAKADEAGPEDQEAFLRRHFVPMTAGMVTLEFQVELALAVNLVFQVKTAQLSSAPYPRMK
ncbi:hypothetical protein [Bradyrhizobium sp. Gha]|uniref:hypothetical protein n=1 Tax=Bradyrhizobium sp. Gha TaxID=1855318 RepID=UPI001FCD2648|nr:hypothetical protein [Bradyrhizobium sp. Gha]